MNDRIEAAPDTVPNASTAHMAIVFQIADRFQGFVSTLSESTTMSPDDQADTLGALLDEIDRERARIVSARESAFRLAELENLIADEEAAEARWNAANNGGMPQ